MAKAIVAYARHFHYFDEPTEDGETNNKDLQNSGWLLETSDFSALPGKGIQCLVNEKMILVGFYSVIYNQLFAFGPALATERKFCFILFNQVGNRKLMSENAITIPDHAEKFVEDLEESAKTGVIVAYNGELVGVMGIADPLKREAAVVVEGLLRMSVRPIMVTGDNWRTARAVAKEVRILIHNLWE